MLGFCWPGTQYPYQNTCHIEVKILVAKVKNMRQRRSDCMLIVVS